MENDTTTPLWMKTGAQRTGVEEFKLAVGLAAIGVLVPLAIVKTVDVTKLGINKIRVRRAAKKAEKENKEEK